MIPAEFWVIQDSAAVKVPAACESAAHARWRLRDQTSAEHWRLLEQLDVRDRCALLDYARRLSMVGCEGRSEQKSLAFFGGHTGPPGSSNPFPTLHRTD